MNRRVALDATVALVLFACIPVVVKSIAANPFTIGIFRLAIATSGVLAVMSVRRELKPLSGADVLRLAAVGLFFFGHWITYFFAVKVSSASVGAIGLSTYGVHLLILGALFGESRVHLSDVAAVVMAVTGAILVVPEFRLDNAVAMGMSLACLSGLMYAALPILHRRWSHLGTNMRALGQFAFALLLFVFFASLSSWSTLTGGDWLGLIFLAIGPTMIGHTLWVRVTTAQAPTMTSIIYYGNIPIAIGLSALVLNEPLTARMVSGALLIMGGGIFGLSMQRRRERRAYGSSGSAYLPSPGR